MLDSTARNGQHIGIRAFTLGRAVHVGNRVARSTRVHVGSVGIEAGLRCLVIPEAEILTFVVGSVGSVGVDRLASISTGELAVAHLLVHPVGFAIGNTGLVSYGRTRFGVVAFCCVKVTYKVVGHDRIHLIILLVAKDAEVVVT